MEDEVRVTEGVLEKEKRGEEERVNVCISVLSAAISPPVMQNGETDRDWMGDVIFKSIRELLPPLTLKTPANEF